jgi:NADH dehydrogenase
MILVVGATGTLGGRITRDLLAKGKAVRILVRDRSPSTALAVAGMATSAESLVAAGAEAVTGDLADRAALDAACAGVDTVISTATATKRNGDLEAVDLNGTLSLIDAARRARVHRFIYTSAYGSVVGHPVPLFHFKGICEEALMGSDMTWTVLLPNAFAEMWIGMVIGIPLQAGAPVTLVGEANHRHAYISETDVAAFAVAIVDYPLAENARIAIGGPSYSWREVVDLAGRAIGQALPVKYVPLGSEVPLLPPAASDMLSAWETYESAIDMGDLPAQLGVELTPLPVVLEQMFSPRTV